MSGIQRFDARLVTDPQGNKDVLMRESRDGLFVRYEDHLAEIERLKNEFDGKRWYAGEKMGEEIASLRVEVEILQRARRADTEIIGRWQCEAETARKATK